MAYTPNVPNAYDTGLIPVSVRADYFRETLLLSPLSLFMGDSETSVIQVKNVPNGNGTSTDFNFGRNIDYKNPIKGYDQISGKGTTLKFYTDRVNVDLQAIPDKLYGVELTRLTTPIDVFFRMKEALQDAHKQNLVWSLLQSATYDSYNVLQGGTGPTTNRRIYGLNRAGATIYEGVDAMAGTTDWDGDGLSVDAIRKLRNLAIYGGTTFESEKRITPYKLETEQGFSSPYYVYFMDTPSYTSLEGDPKWSLYNSRGFKEMANQPSALSGAFFKGQIDNVLIYEVPELGNCQVTANGKTASWNLFCGAQAFGLVWHKEPWFTQEWSNHNTVVEQAVLEIRGQKTLKFPSFNSAITIPVENGLIHHFVKIA